MSNKNDDFSKIEDFSENAHRVRRNLLIFSCIGWLLYYSGHATKINKIDILGTNLNDIPNALVPAVLLLIIFYHWCHFVWLVIEHCKYNLLSLSRVGKKGVHGNLGVIDTTYDDWNLYLWWKRSFNDFDKSFVQANKIIDKNLKFFETCINESKNSDKDSIFRKIRETESNLLGIKQTLESLKGIEPSLRNFDNSYKSYSRISRFRWYILEFGIPIVIGLFAVSFLCCEIYKVIKA